METYKIIRFYFSGKKETIRKGVTLEVAQLHCNDPKTSKDGVYFDGYTKE
jgi:hypothetical protein